MEKENSQINSQNERNRTRTRAATRRRSTLTKEAKELRRASQSPESQQTPALPHRRPHFVALRRDAERLVQFRQGFLVELVLVVDALEDRDDVRLEDHAGHDDLVQDVVDLVRVEDEVELADVLEALVQRLDEDLNEVQDACGNGVAAAPRRTADADGATRLRGRWTGRGGAAAATRGSSEGTSRGAAAAATWIVRGRVEATPRPG